MAPKQVSDKSPMHLKCHLILTMATKEEAQRAVKDGFSYLAHPSRFENTIFADSKASALKLELKLTFRHSGFDWDIMGSGICDSSTIVVWNGTDVAGKEFLPDAIEGIDVFGRNNYESVPSKKHGFQLRLWPSNNSDSKKTCFDSHVGEFFPFFAFVNKEMRNRHSAAELDFVALSSNNHARYSLFKIERFPKDSPEVLEFDEVCRCKCMATRVQQGMQYNPLTMVSVKRNS